MSKHLAEQSVKTIYVEAAYFAMFDKYTPDRNGTHRKEDA